MNFTTFINFYKLQENAKGNNCALYCRSFIQKLLYELGNFVQENKFKVLLFITILFSICCYGLKFVRVQTDIVKLWVDS